jgi:hypothetical protein
MRIISSVRRFLQRLGLIKPTYVTGRRARVFVDGREVAFWKGETVEFDPIKIEPIQTLGKLEVIEIVDAQINARIVKEDK